MNLNFGLQNVLLLRIYFHMFSSIFDMANLSTFGVQSVVQVDARSGGPS